MKALRIATQCTASNGKTGSFAFVDGDIAPFTAVSPIFDNLTPLFTWLHVNGWVPPQSGFGAYTF
jgi:hypothetical protein